jgi:hypothetical protein
MNVEPHLIRIGDLIINLQHIASAHRTSEDGGSLSVYMVGVRDDPIVLTGENAQKVWDRINKRSTAI